MKRLTLSLLCVALSLSACAQDGPPSVAAKPGAKSTAPAKEPKAIEPFVKAGTPEARARDAVRRINSQIPIDYVGAAPFPGFRAVVAGGQLVYISDDGKYLVQGNASNTLTGEDLSSETMNAVRRKLVATIPAKDRIVFAPPNPKYTVTIFTDVECGYCRKFHGQIADVNKQGIAVEYLAFPRMGLGSPDHQKMVDVWCAADRKKALTDAKSDRPVPSKSCTNPVTMEYDVGQRVGLTGTPMILAPDGTTLGGYLTPQQLRAALDKLSAGKSVGRSNATDPSTGRGGAGGR
ncbi:DsbC family protein [Lysobacter sp. A6]|uniref:Thiol:disulfide interchange protein n=1 Tax=Noviluteimonas lactosilytica TaxID=2888523 RepID=A0ABS8JG39_9GAMM|nr:DsbC family protein [Lysobacter lactosilyticus]MCC8362564.1 DsbC family protein [Lysobacter lactosilyticus]